LNLTWASLPAQGHCLKDLGVDYSQVNRNAIGFALKTTLLVIAIAGTAGAGYYLELFSAQRDALSYQNSAGVIYACRHNYQSNWLCDNPSDSPCMNFMNQCLSLSAKCIGAGFGFGLGFFTSIVGLVGSAIFGEKFFKSYQQAQEKIETQKTRIQ